MTNWSVIDNHICNSTGLDFIALRRSPVTGGCINSAFRLDGKAGSFFVKLNNAAQLETFVAEVDGLRAIANVGALRVPQPICWGRMQDQAYLVLEFIALNHRANDHGIQFGQQLARLHRRTSKHFGWLRNNTIGSNPQINTPCDSWVEFWRKYRLGWQLELAEKNGYGSQIGHIGERLCSDFKGFFSSYEPQASLLHGDLWSGNYATDQQGNTVIFDPAVYYGDRETDLAMMELFGNFPPAFLSSYCDNIKLDDGYTVRKTLYNLYHILNHLNLFGGGYLAQSKRMIDLLLRELGSGGCR